MTWSTTTSMKSMLIKFKALYKYFRNKDHWLAGGSMNAWYRSSKEVIVWRAS